VGHAVGELDAFNATEFRSKMEAIASSSRVVLDLGGVSFVDSAGLGSSSARCVVCASSTGTSHSPRRGLHSNGSSATLACFASFPWLQRGAVRSRP